MGDQLKVKPEALTDMAKATVDGAEAMQEGWRNFLGPCVASVGAFGNTPAGATLDRLTRQVAASADLIAQSVIAQLHADADRLGETAKGYADTDHHGAGILGELGHLIGNIL